MEAPATITIEPPDPARLAEQVSSVLSSGSAGAEKIEHLLHTAIGLVNAAGAIFFSAPREGPVVPVVELLSKQARAWSDSLVDECASRAGEALNSRRAALTRLEGNPAVSIISCPVTPQGGGESHCLSVVAVIGDGPVEPYLIVLQLLAATMTQALGTGTPSSLLQRFREDAMPGDGREAGTVLQDWFGCEILALGTRDERGRTGVAFISNVTSPDRKTHRSRLYQKIMQECLHTGKQLFWAQDGDIPDGFENSLLVKELVQDSGMQQGAALSLRGVHSCSVGLVLLWSKGEDRSGKLGELTGGGHLLAPFLYQLLSRPGSPSGTAGGATATAKRVLITAGVLLVLGWFGFYPIDFNLHPDVRVTPVQVRYVVAAFDGIIEDVFAEPGDQVEEGEELISLDGREIALELSSIGADSTKALKMRDSQHVRGDVAGAQMAQLEYQRLQERAKLLMIRQSQLQIASPSDGIVLSGDLARSRGGPVSKGQVLMEIAPLETVLLEIGIADEDISHVAPGMDVSVRFDAFPQRSWQGRIEKIAPKSALIDGENLFVATLELENGDGVLQPGMQGSSRILCGKRSAAWIYFHKPWYSLQRLLSSIF